VLKGELARLMSPESIDAEFRSTEEALFEMGTNNWKPCSRSASIVGVSIDRKPMGNNHNKRSRISNDSEHYYTQNRSAFPHNVTPPKSRTFGQHSYANIAATTTPAASSITTNTNTTNLDFEEMRSNYLNMKENVEMLEKRISRTSNDTVQKLELKMEDNNSKLEKKIIVQFRSELNDSNKVNMDSMTKLLKEMTMEIKESINQKGDEDYNRMTQMQDSLIQSNEGNTSNDVTIENKTEIVSNTAPYATTRSKTALKRLNETINTDMVEGASFDDLGMIEYNTPMNDSSGNDECPKLE
jgi:hypothetical protein